MFDVTWGGGGMPPGYQDPRGGPPGQIWMPSPIRPAPGGDQDRPDPFMPRPIGPTPDLPGWAQDIIGGQKPGGKPSGKKSKSPKGRAEPNPWTDILSPVTPQGVYDPQQTERAINQLYAQSVQSSHMGTAQKGFDAPGRSRDPGTETSALLRKVIPAKAGAAAGAEDVRFGDRMANMQNLLQTQSANEGFAQQITGNEIGNMAGRQDQQMGILQMLLSMFGMGGQ